MTARTPLTRPFRHRRLDAVRDRLAYRTAPLGLLATDLIGDSALTTGLTTGEDIAFALRVWFSGARISFDRRGPGYLVHDEADQQRVTTVVRAVADEFAFLPFVLDADWFIALPERMRRAIATKLLRNHVVPAILVRVAAGVLTEEERAAFAEIVERIRASASAPEAVLAVRDAQLLMQVTRDAESVRRAAEGYGPLLSPRGLLPSTLTQLFAGDAPPRLLGAAVFARS
jgi:hypothetical protein